jgi:hypothetical protein
MPTTMQEIRQLQQQLFEAQQGKSVAKLTGALSLTFCSRLTLICPHFLDFRSPFAHFLLRLERRRARPAAVSFPWQYTPNRPLQLTPKIDRHHLPTPS